MTVSLETNAVSVEAMLSANAIVLFLVFHGCGHKTRMEKRAVHAAKSMRALQHAIFTEVQTNWAFSQCLFVHTLFNVWRQNIPHKLDTLWIEHRHWMPLLGGEAVAKQLRLAVMVVERLT